jgi:tripartite-type tricarboxylate transporter receptor subunit TctC
MSSRASFPDVPTLAEAGFPDASVTSWYAWLAPAGTPRPAIERLNRELTRLASDPDVVAKVETLGGSALPAATPAEVDAMLAKETAFWTKFIKEVGLKIE